MEDGSSVDKYKTIDAQETIMHDRSDITEMKVQSDDQENRASARSRHEKVDKLVDEVSTILGQSQ